MLPSVHAKQLAGDGLGIKQVVHRRADVFRVCSPSKQRAGALAREMLRRLPFVSNRRAGRDRIDPNIRRKRDRSDPGERPERGFGDRVASRSPELGRRPSGRPS